MSIARTARNVLMSRIGGRVERCHNLPHVGSYSNAAHSWGVAMLLHYLWPEDFARLAIYCLSHDVPEAWVGDVPAPVLREFPVIRQTLHKAETALAANIGLPSESQLDPEDAMKVKACDRLDFWLWCRDQLALGNTNVHGAMTTIEDYLFQPGTPRRAAEFFNYMKEYGDAHDSYANQQALHLKEVLK